jgi:chromosome segregation ATPase
MTMTRDTIDMLNVKDTPSECSDYTRLLKENPELKRALIEARDEYSYQYRQHEDEISELEDECLYLYRQQEDAKAEEEQMKDDSGKGV